MIKKIIFLMMDGGYFVNMRTFSGRHVVRFYDSRGIIRFQINELTFVEKFRVYPDIFKTKRNGIHNVISKSAIRALDGRSAPKRAYKQWRKLNNMSSQK